MDDVMASATGDRPFDRILKNTRYVNVFTGEIYPADIGITNGRIAHVTQPGEAGLDNGPVDDCGGRFAIPGLIDTHIHIESTMLTPANFARAAIPRGTTTILADPHEICNVLGLKGMLYCIEAGKDIGLRVLWAAPSCVPSVVGVESSRMVFNAPEIDAMLAMPGVHALGEVMDYPGVIGRTPRMTAITRAARKRGKLIQGHVMGVTSRELSAYMAAGIESDHESRELEEVLMKLRSGMVVECRNGSVAKNIPVEAKALALLDYPPNATLCTDDREADDLLREGHMDEALRQAIRWGIPPVKAIQMATRNAAAFLGLRDRGGLKPGSLADIVLLDELETASVHAVFIGGILCAKKGELIIDIASSPNDIESCNTMYLKRDPVREDFLIPAESDSVRLHAISFENGDPFITHLETAAFIVKDGYADINSVGGCVTMAVLERHNATGNIGLAPVLRFGLKRGAVAATVAHDSHNLFLFGRNADDMAVAAQHLVRSGGGFVAVDEGKILAEIRLPVCGLLSTLPVREVAAEVAAMKTVLNNLGISSTSPVNFLTWFCLAVLPEVRLTDRGLVDTRSQKPVPLRAEKA